MIYIIYDSYKPCCNNWKFFKIPVNNTYVRYVPTYNDWCTKKLIQTIHPILSNATKQITHTITM